jgi:uncharacterized RDD family membrane protein YckC
MSWGEELRIETPEQIDFNLEIAGPASRFYAQLLDWIVKLFIVAALALTALGAAMLAGSVSTGAGIFLLALAGAAAFVFCLGYDIYFEGCRNGQTPGKASAGLRVVRDDGGPIDVRAAAVRNLLGLADFLPLCYLGGGLIAALNSRGQRLGDMAAGTVVIRERTSELSDDLEARIEAIAGREFAFGPHELANCNDNDLHVLLSFFARAQAMESASIDQLADRLCATFLQRTGYRPASPVVEYGRSFACLAALYRDLKALRRHT